MKSSLIPSLLSLLLPLTFSSPLHNLPCSRPTGNGSFTPLPPTIGARQESSTTYHPETRTIFLIGGIPSNSTNTSPLVPTLPLVETYSLANNSWSLAPPLPEAMNHANTASVGGYVYVLGGLTGNASNGRWSATGSCYRFSPRTRKWESLPPMPNGTERGSSAIGLWEEKIFLAGGLTSLNLAEEGKEVSVDVVTAYDTVTGEWEVLPNLPEARDHLGGAVFGGEFFAVGGRDGGAENPRNSTFVLDLRGGFENGTMGERRREWEWERRAPMITARGGLMMGRVGGWLYTFGGEGDMDTSTGVFPQVEGYEIEKDRWVSLGVMDVPRHGTVAASIGDGIYIPGGGLVEGAGPTAFFSVYRPCGGSMD